MCTHLQGHWSSHSGRLHEGVPVAPNSSKSWFSCSDCIHSVSSRGITCRRRMCLVQVVTSPHHLRSAKSLERWVRLFNLPSLPPSQLVGVWVLADWMAGGQPRDWSLIELGPGRGTLLKDILRVFGQFRRVCDSLSVHLVEASPAMSRVQEATLTG